MHQALIETVECPVCGTHEYTVLRSETYPEGLSKEQLLGVYSSSSDSTLFDQLVKCLNCSLVYLNPRIREDVILESYENAVDPTFIQQDEYRVNTFKRSLKTLIKKYNLKCSSSTNILDVGCAGGAFPKAAADMGFTVVGIEPSRWLAERARQHYALDIRAGTLADQDFGNMRFDLITLWDVIEHLTDPSKVISQIKTILKDDGLFIVNYPDYNSFARRILGFKWPFFLSVHLIYFSPKTITRLLRDHGFEVVKIIPFYQTLELGYVLKRASVYFKIFGVFELLSKKIGIYNLPLTYNMGQSFLIAKQLR